MDKTNNKTNKKINFERVWPFLVCIVLAFLIWLYVMYINTPEYEYKYDDIQISVRNLSSKLSDYAVELEKEELSATFRGKNVDLAQCSASDIKAVLDLSSISDPGTFVIPVTYEYPVGITLDCMERLMITVSIVAPQSRYLTGIPVIIERNGLREGELVEGYTLSASPETVEAYITSTDEAFATMDPASVIAIADISALDISAPGTYQSVKLKFISQEGVKLNDPNIYVTIIAEKNELN